MNKYVFKKDGKFYKIPRLIFLLRGKVKFYFEYNGKLYDKKINVKDKEVKQISILTEALNIKKYKDMLSYVYDEACNLLDDDFYGKNICGFKCGKCINDRLTGRLGNGCCCDGEHKTMCKYLTNKGCSIKCLACKLHICSVLKEKGYKYKLNDIYVLKYLLTLSQKIIIYNDFFMTKEEVLKDVRRRSLILWIFSKKRDFVEYNLKEK